MRTITILTVPELGSISLESLTAVMGGCKKHRKPCGQPQQQQQEAAPVQQQQQMAPSDPQVSTTVSVAGY